MPATLTITNALRTVAAKIRNSWNGFSITYTNTPTDVGYGVATAPGAGASS